MARAKLYIGIDIGKSKIAGGLVSENGGKLEGVMSKTDLSHGGRNIVGQVQSLIEELSSLARREVGGVGLSVIGIVDAEKGIVTKSSIPALSGLAIGSMMRKRTGLPVTVDNDLNCPAFGEYVFGAGKKSSLLVYFTISTGAGISTIRNGRVEHGAHGLAGFIGNTRLLRDGSELESRFSGAAIAERASEAIGIGVTTEEAFGFAKDPSSPIYRVISDAEHYAATVVAAVQMMIDPDIIVFGGSVATNHPEHVARIKERAEIMVDRGMVQLPGGINIVVSKLGQFNGVLGAAAMVMQKHAQG